MCHLHWKALLHTDLNKAGLYDQLAGNQSGMGCLYVQDILDVNASKHQLLEIPKSLPFLSSYGPVGAATLGTNCKGQIGGI